MSLYKVRCCNNVVFTHSCSEFFYQVLILICARQEVNLNPDHKKLYVKLLKYVADGLLIIPGKCISMPINSNDFELDIFSSIFWYSVLECFLYLDTNKKFLNIKLNQHKNHYVLFIYLYKIFLFIYLVMFKIR